MRTFVNFEAKVNNVQSVNGFHLGEIVGELSDEAILQFVLRSLDASWLVQESALATCGLLCGLRMLRCVRLYADHFTFY